MKLEFNENYRTASAVLFEPIILNLVQLDIATAYDRYADINNALFNDLCNRQT
jgi:hypothetical protein